MIDDLAGALMLLSRLPAGWLSRTPAAPDRAAWALPLVGALLGGIAGGAGWAGLRLGLPPLPAAIGTLAILLALTGALHEDGLADTADGFGGGRDPARTLAIMRDSRIGAFGALALIVSLLLRATSLAALPAALWLPALAATGAVARGGMLVALLALPPARADGLGAGIAAARPGRLWAGVLLGAACCPLVLPAARAGGVLLVVALGVAGMIALARRQVGGVTGDVLGAVEQVAECAALIALAAAR